MCKDSQSNHNAISEEGNTMIKVLHWILGISGSISLILAAILKMVNVVILHAGPQTFFEFTIACGLASIALSLIDLSSNLKKNSTSKID
jgi:hypothetical protein